MKFTKWTALWVVWIGAFFAIEIPALDDGGTLSEHVWVLVQSPLAAWVLAGGLGWLVVHFLSRARWK